MNATTNASPFAIAPYAERALRRGLEFGAAFRWPALAASVLLIGSVGAALAQPVLISWVIDRGVLESDIDALRLSVLLLLGAVAAEAALSAGHLLLFASVGERYLARLRSRVFEHLSQLSLRFYDAHNTGELISRASADVQTLSTLVRNGMSSFLTGVLMLVLGILARLLARLYDPEHGDIAYGELNLRDASLASVRRRIVLLPQEGHLFRGTVADNIRLSRPEASDTEITKVVSDLGLEERFRRFPDGLLTEVDERGTRLSAGERQLVSLARVALVNPEVAILDEALSNVDPGTEVLVQRAMRRLMGGRTVIVIAHRETTAQRADRVAFLDDGVLAAHGRHDELLRTSSAYVRLWGQAHVGA